MNLPEISVHDGITVVRDDKIRGGTKVRCLSILLQGASEFVYASPVQGYAQVALAIAGKALGKRITIFCAKRGNRHPRTVEALAEGAKVVEVEVGYLSVVRSRATKYCEVASARMLPFGLDDPAFISALRAVAITTGLNPTEVWSVAGSGVLTRALQQAWPRADFHAVQIGAVPKLGKARLHVAPERFEKDAQFPPPFPSCSNYDAKAWRFIRAQARPGAVFWNTAA